MNDIDWDIQTLQGALERDDQQAAMSAGLRLLCGFLKDVRRIADAASNQSKGD